ncbi:MAG: AAA family ATPase [Christensenellales bacterium]
MVSKKLPVGIENFEEMRKEDFYYVDKTGLIIDLMNGWSKVNLFTRPRRFGKTLNMSMLKSFFEIGGDKSIFDGLVVSNDKVICDRFMGQYPVVFISLKGVDGLDFKTAYEALCQIIVDEAARLRFLVDSDKIADDEKKFLEKLINERYDASDIRKSLQMLCRLLEKHYGQKTILIIDEYDVPLDKAFHHGYYAQMIDIIRAMFGAALKTNDSLFMAVLTGCLRVSKESIFTGLNNLKVHSISDEKFDEYFGFTDAEVRKMLEYYGLESHYSDVRKWYDGYRFGGQDIYCPWDVINYCYDACSSAHAQPKAYWINTSGNEMVRRLISRGTDGTTQMDIERLIAGETITKTLNENLTHNEIDANIENIWSLLYMTGYLTAVGYPNGRQYELRIPNMEVRQIYMEQVLDWFKGRAAAQSDKLTGLYEAFESGSADAIKEYLDEQLLDTVSYYDARESFYHGFLLALLSTCANWRVSSNVETGKGRSDIVVERRDRKVGFVVEVKDVKEYEKLDAACETALRQIEEKDYTAILRRYRVKNIWTYGIAFWEKECRVVVRKTV